MGWGGRQGSHSSCGLDQRRGILLAPIDPVDISSMGKGIGHGGKRWRMPRRSKQQGPGVQASQVLRGGLCLGDLVLLGGAAPSPGRKPSAQCPDAITGHVSSKWWGAWDCGGNSVQAWVCVSVSMHVYEFPRVWGRDGITTSSSPTTPTAGMTQVS